MARLIALALASTALFAGAALAAEAPPAAKPDAAAKPAKTDKKPNLEEKLICTRESSTDSFLTKRVCRTRAQIDEDRRAAQRLEDDRQLNSGRPDQVRR